MQGANDENSPTLKKSPPSVSKILDESSIGKTLSEIRRPGITVAYCHGVFDLLHPGHLDHLAEAKAMADVLVVAVTSDEFVNKGPGRPVFKAETRARMLSALEIVDFVIVSHYATAVALLDLVKPDFYVKGPDYRDPSQDATGNIASEMAVTEQNGGTVIFTDAPTMSSSSLINFAGLAHTEELKQWLTSVKNQLSESEIDLMFEEIAGLRVLVIGEAIIDRYVFCEALGKTSKEPVLAFLRKTEEVQMGGTLAIAKHVAGLGAMTTILTRVGDDSWGQLAKKEISKFSAITPILQTGNVSKTIVKTRFVDESTGTKVFETYEMTDGATSQEEDENFAALLVGIVNDFDLVLVADYGHGLLSNSVIQILAQSEVTLCVNTQSNAGNRGFNSISRYGRVDIVCLNGSELQLELRRKNTTVRSLLPELGTLTGANWLITTEGAKGLSIWSPNNEIAEMPAFTSQVTDRIGAGDALYAVVSLLLKIGAPLSAVGLFGNLAGASMVSEIGNRNSLDTVSLKRHARITLK